MHDRNDSTGVLLYRASRGSDSAIHELLSLQIPRIRRFVAFRLDSRLKDRLDVSDVIQDVLAEASRRLPTYLEEQAVPFYVWIRRLTWDAYPVAGAARPGSARPFVAKCASRVARRFGRGLGESVYGSHSESACDAERSAAASPFGDRPAIRRRPRVADHEVLGRANAGGNLRRTRNLRSGDQRSAPSSFGTTSEAARDERRNA